MEDKKKMLTKRERDERRARPEIACCMELLEELVEENKALRKRLPQKDLCTYPKDLCTLAQDIK